MYKQQGHLLVFELSLGPSYDLTGCTNSVHGSQVIRASCFTYIPLDTDLSDVFVECLRLRLEFQLGERCLVV
jgi:hypothetical protein